MNTSNAISHQIANLWLAMFSRDLCSHISEFTIDFSENLCPNVKFLLPERKYRRRNQVWDDANRIGMHVNTTIELNGTQKISFADLTSFSYMCTYS